MRLLHHYKLDNNTTDSISGNNLILQGGVSFAEGISGKCINADASGKYAYTEKGVDLSGNYSISVWIKTPLPVTTDGWRTIIQQTGLNHPIIVQLDGLLGVYNLGFVSTGFNVNTLANGWHNIIAVASTTLGYTKMYVDGVFVGNAMTKTTGTTSLIIGNAGVNQWAGMIDDVRIYNYCLSLKEIKELYKGLIIHESMKVNNSKWHVNATFYSSFDNKLVDESYNYVTPRNLVPTNVNTKLGPDKFGRPNKAAYFDGTAYLDLGAYTTTKQVTYNTWIKLPDTISARMIPVDHGINARIIDIHAYNDWEVDIGNGSGWTSVNRIVPPADYRGKWVMVTMSIDFVAGVCKYYFNGVLNNTINFTAGVISASSLIRLGELSSGTGYKFTGYIDEFMMFNVALPDNTVTHLYNITKNHKLNEPISPDGTPDLFKYTKRGVGNECVLSYDVINTYKGGQEPWTISCMVKDILQTSTDGDTQDVRLGWYGGNYKGPYIVINRVGQVYYTIGQGNTSGSWNNYDSGVVYTITDNNQHHIALVYDGSYVRLYVDGVEKHSYAIGVYVDSGAKDQNFRIGSSNPWDNWSGSVTTMKMYDAKLFARDLTPSEVVDEYKLAMSLTKENVIFVNGIMEDLPNSSEIARWTFNNTLRSTNGNFQMSAYDTNLRFDAGYKGWAIDTQNSYAGMGKKLFLPKNQNFALSFLLTPKIDITGIGSTAFFSMGGDYQNWILGDCTYGHFRFYHLANGGGGNSFYSNTIAQVNQTYHVVFDYNDGVKKIYVNGVLENTESSIINCDTIGELTDFGRRMDTGAISDYFWKGLIEDVRVYGKSLSATEVSTLYRILTKPNIDKETGLNIANISSDGVVAPILHSAPLKNSFNGVINGAYTDKGLDNNSQSSYAFDGVDDYLETTESYVIDTRYNSYTINVWIKPQAFAGNYGALITDSSAGQNSATFGIWVYGNSIGAWAAGNMGSWAATGVNLFDGNWHMITAQYTANASTFTPTRMYCDGVYIGNSTTDRSSYLSYTGKLGYGNTFGSYETNYKGNMTDGKIYIKALTDGEIKDMYERNKPSITKKTIITNQIIEN